MKKLISISAILILFIFLSCSSESSASKQEIASGEWKLINVQGGIPGSNYSFTTGLITWSFDPVEHMVSVLNNNTDDTLIDLFDTGNYIYQTSSNPNPMGCGETITFDEGSSLGCIYMENGNLIINSLSNDGFKLTFIQ